MPLTILRRLDCVLKPVKASMLEPYEQIKGKNYGDILDTLTNTTGLWNTSKLDMAKLLDDPDNIADNLLECIAGFSDVPLQVHAITPASDT